MTWVSKVGLRCFLAALPLMLLFVCISGRAQVGAPIAVDTHLYNTSAESIRHHRLKHLDDRLNLAPGVLKAQCRYESEIAIAPAPRKVVLTFDDGPEPGQTEFILDTLKKYGIGAVFFLVGHKAQAHPELVARIQAEGRHLIGNHSWEHPNFHDLDAASQAREVEKTEAVLGLKEGAKLFRYPYGNATCETNAFVHARHYGIIGWHIDSCDWAYERTGSIDSKEAMICGVLPQHRAHYTGHVMAAVRAHNGGIVLLHEIHPRTVRQLEKIITDILAEGFVFTSLNDADFVTSIR